MHVPRWLILALLTSSGLAVAHPPPDPCRDPSDDSDECPHARETEPHRPIIEWGALFRVDYTANQRPADTSIARGTVSTPSDPTDVGDGWQATVGAELTLPIAAHGDVRIGPWIEARGFTTIVAGGELIIGRAPRKLDLFFYPGEGILVARVGGGRDQYTGALAWGYRAPWKLGGPWAGASRYMIGARVVLTGTRAVQDPSNWSVGLGVEVEPIGALRYLLGIRSLY